MDTLEIRPRNDVTCLVDIIRWKNETPQQVLARLYPNDKLCEFSVPGLLSLDMRAVYCTGYEVADRSGARYAVLIALE